jgi:hypothetical protein
MGYRFKEGNKVREGNVSLNVVDRGKYETPITSKNFDKSLDLGSHFFWRAKRKGRLGIDSSSPECEMIPELAF